MLESSEDKQQASFHSIALSLLVFRRRGEVQRMVALWYCEAQTSIHTYTYLSVCEVIFK